MNVVDMLKKSLAFSLGAAALSAEKLKQMSDELVARGEMSQEEARHFVDDVSRKAEEEKGAIQEWMREQASKMLQQAGAADAARVALLESRVTALEAKMLKLTGEVEAVEEASAKTQAEAAEKTEPSSLESE